MLIAHENFQQHIIIDFLKIFYYVNLLKFLVFWRHIFVTKLNSYNFWGANLCEVLQKLPWLSGLD